MIGRFNHSITHSLNLAPLSAFSAVEASVRSPALLRNLSGEEVCETASIPEELLPILSVEVLEDRLDDQVIDRTIVLLA
jgi:hypothetical protein